MNKIKNLISFIIVIIIIFIIFFCIYANIDAIIPKYENEVFIIQNNIDSEDNDFLYEMVAYLEKADIEYQSNKESLSTKDNNIIYNLIKYAHYGYDEAEIEEIYKILLNNEVGTINDTIYGNLNVLTGEGNIFVDREDYKIGLATKYYIAYSEDMSKLYWNFMRIYDKNQSSVTNSQSTSGEIYSSTNGKTPDKDILEAMGMEDKKNTITEEGARKDEIIKKGKEALAKISTELKFNPDTVTYKKPYYVLKDTDNDITLYYDKEDNQICGFYMGFGK